MIFSRSKPNSPRISAFHVQLTLDPNVVLWLAWLKKMSQRKISEDFRDEVNGPTCRVDAMVDETLIPLNLGTGGWAPS